MVILRYFLTIAIQCMMVIIKLMEYWKFIRKGLRALLKLLLHKGV